VLALAAFAHAGYPVTVTNCGIKNTYAKKPMRTVTMNQGATELMLHLGLEGNMVGTAYLDDEIWPKYKEAYDRIPVLNENKWEYPTDKKIMAYNPDFIVGSYNSAFRNQYITTSGTVAGIFNTTLDGPCEGVGSEYNDSDGNATVWNSCRPQLHAANIGTYLFEDACEDLSLKKKGSEETVYEEMQAIGKIFDVNVQPHIDEMKKDFELAARMITSSMGTTKMKTVWLDCVGRCCKDDKGVPDPDKVYVGAGQGTPNMLMQEAGLENSFKDKTGNWHCVTISELAARKPDIIVVVDAGWNSAEKKVKNMYNDARFCELEALKAARFVKIPFSATTLSPRNGPAALDLAIAAIHVKKGPGNFTHKSGVSSFSQANLQSFTAGLKCPVVKAKDMVYTDATTDTPPPVPADKKEVSEAFGYGYSLWRLASAAVIAACGAFA